MKAIRFHAHGGPDQLRFEDAPDPFPGPGEVTVRVAACALNYLDIWQRKGIPGVAIPLPHISGSDIAGTVEAAGPDVAQHHPGERVVVCPGSSCLHCVNCLNGQDNRCPDYRVVGYLSDGGYAEFVRVPATSLLPCPDSLAFTEAAAVPLVFMTAWHMLVRRCSIQPGEWVLVVAAGSGVGSAAIQIAKRFGATVIASAGSDTKLAAARELGADFLVHHGRESIRAEVLKLTDRRGVDIVFEHVGAATWSECVSALARGGRLVTCGATSGHEVELNLRHLFAKQLSVLGSYMGTKGDLIQVLEMVRAGRLRPVVSQVFPLRDAAIAQQSLEDRAHFGKVVLAI